MRGGYKLDNTTPELPPPIALFESIHVLPSPSNPSSATAPGPS